MLHHIKDLYHAAIITTVIVTSAGAAFAQMDNKPFSFNKRGSDGVGMSNAGRQAIIEEKIFDSTPDNLQRDSGGYLLDVTKGPGGTALVTRQNGTFLPGYSGTDFRDDNPFMRVGAFNPFFNPIYVNGHSYMDLHTASVLGSWIGNVSAGVPFPYYDSANTINSWTVFVNSLNSF